MRFDGAAPALPNGGMVGIARRRHEFRTSWWVRGAVLAALALWVAIGGWALVTGALPFRAFLGVVFFVVFFTAFALHFWRMAYVVDQNGVTVKRGRFGSGFFPWESIESVKRSDVPLGGWEVMTARGVFVLDAFIAKKARLVDVIVARAGLFQS